MLLLNKHDGFSRQVGNPGEMDAKRASRPVQSVYDWLTRWAEAKPDAPAIAEWRDDQRNQWLAYADVARLVGEIAGGMRQWVKRGDRVMLVLPNGVDFYCSFIACSAIGAVAVPSPTPNAGRAMAFSERLADIADDCQPALVVTQPEWADAIAEVMRGRCPTVTREAVLGAAKPGGGPPPTESFPVALLQYTSGSTRRPRAISVTHESLHANCSQAAEAYTETPADVGVTWVPLYHDLGLNTGVTRPLFSGYPSVLLRPADFVRKPLTWLRAIETCGGTFSSAPNFAYDLCVRKVSRPRAAELNLSRWRVARNAGEVVRADTVERFTEHFAVAGFAANALCTGYGLAEATLSVSTCTPAVRPLRLTVRRADLQQGVVDVVPGPVRPDAPVQSLLSSGTPLSGTQVRAGDGHGRIGPISIRGPQVLSGNKPDHDTQSRTPADADGWHETGDLGFIFDGHLFVVGRSDDTVIYHGRNFYLADVVALCDGIEGLRPGRLVPFVVRDEDIPADTGCIVVELRPGAEPDAEVLAAIAAEIRRRLLSTLEFFITHVVFVSDGTLPITTSGKLRASETKRRFEAGSLSVLATL